MVHLAVHKKTFFSFTLANVHVCTGSTQLRNEAMLTGDV
jgi:hypothetical protein